MTIRLPEKVRHIIGRLAGAGHEAYAVGGCVRDSILGREPGDWDITTSATPEEVKGLFPRTVDTGIRHGTVTVLCGREGFEVTTYRIDGEYEDMRHPGDVTFTRSLLEDLRRRDFTINAMAYSEAGGLVDEFDGMGDLEKGIVRCVGDPAERFSEDALRMMRAVRFGAQLGFSIESGTRDAICRLSGNLSRISAERIRDELVKLLVSGHPDEMRTVYETGMSRVFLPEFDDMMDTPQNNKHHCYNVGEHTLVALCHIRADRVLRLAMLLHDVGKPRCKSRDEEGIYHFYGHPEVGARMAGEILRRLKFDNETIRRVTPLIVWHDDRPPLEEREVRHAIHRIGMEQFPALFEVKRADALAKNTYKREEKMAYIDAYEEMYRDIRSKRQCLCVSDLAINGRDLMRMGIPQGKEIGETLERLLSHVLDCPQDNDADTLRQLALRWRQERART